MICGYQENLNRKSNVKILLNKSCYPSLYDSIILQIEILINCSEKLSISNTNRLNLSIIKKLYHYLKKGQRIVSCSLILVILVAVSSSRNVMKEKFVHS